MSRIVINTSSPNDGLGDTLRNAINAINTMTLELYSNVVFKESGKGLSSNDYTTIEKTKLSGIAANAEVNVQSDLLQEDDTQDDFIKNKESVLPIRDPASVFKFLQKGYGNSDPDNNEIGDIFCGWKNGGTIRYSEAKWLGGDLSNSDNFTPLVQIEI